MTWLQITFKTDAGQTDLLTDLLTEAGSLAITLKDAGDHPIYEPDLETTTLWPKVLVIGLFDEECSVSAILKQIDSKFPVTHYCIDYLTEQDWQDVWMMDFKPLSFGKRLQIIPSHYQDQINLQATSILLDPGLAFGTGTHPTTALCLEWLDEHIAGEETVIDYGCGSGILSIAALKLGASKVYAIDHDQQALSATRANAERNSINQEQLITLLPEQLPKGLQADILVANILAQTLEDLAPTLTSLILPQGKIVLSGILESQVARVIEIYEQWFTLSVQLQEEWARIAGIKDPLSPPACGRGDCAK